MPKFEAHSKFHVAGKLYEGTQEKPAIVELPSNKFLIRHSRFVNGRMVYASPNFPAVLELEEGAKLDPALVPLSDPKSKEEPKPHFIPGAVRESERVSNVMSKPLEPDDAVPAQLPAPVKVSKSAKRASDTDVA